MTMIDPSQLDNAKRRTRNLARINRADGWFKVIGLPYMMPLLRTITGDAPRAQTKQLWITLLAPILSILTFLMLWAALAPQVQTSLGVASIDRDLVNVGRVLKPSPMTKVRRLVLPSALPLIFTGLRLSLGVGWMVLIAAEMLARNPGLGKFVWDEFQNESFDSLARIMVAGLTIGIIGFLLDRMIFAIQSLITFSDKG